AGGTVDVQVALGLGRVGAGELDVVGAAHRGDPDTGVRTDLDLDGHGVVGHGRLDPLADPGEGARAGRPVVRAPGHRPHGAVVDVHGGQPQRGAGGQPADGQDGLLAVVLEVGAEAGEGAGVVVRVERRLDDLAQDEARLLAAG